MTTRPAICLSMIVRNQAHLKETLDSVAPYISSWVIVSTGCDDGIQDLIRNHMAALGIPGELHERPSTDFGNNRAEALALAQGHGDYIWVVDSGDVLVGTPDFSRLGADVYWMAYGDDNRDIFWRAQLFRDGLRVRYDGVVREYAAWDDSCIDVRLTGECHIESRRLGTRGWYPPTDARDRDLLLAEVERNPDDGRSVFYLAQSYFELGDIDNARRWFARRIEMGGWYQEIYVAMWRTAETMARLGAPWLEVQDAYLKAWEFLPTRAEALHAVASWCRVDQRYRLGYHYAKLAADIPFPEEDQFFVREDIYGWRATDEQAVCAFYIGKQAEAFTLCRRLLARPDIPEPDRQRIAVNRDLSVPTMFHAESSYPEALIQRLLAGPDEAEVVVSLIAGPDRDTTEQALNSFLRCCLDVSRVGRFLVVDTGMSAQDRTIILERYGFLEFADCGPAEGLGAQLAQIRAQIDGRFWLHLGQGWRFFAPDDLITRLTAVLEAEAQVFQVGINFADAVSRPAHAPPRRRRAEHPMPGAMCWPTWWPAARQCSIPHDWIKPAVWTTSGSGQPRPGYVPPPLTRCSAP